MKERIFCVVLSAVILSLSGCSKSENNGADSQSSADKSNENETVTKNVGDTADPETQISASYPETDENKIVFVTTEEKAQQSDETMQAVNEKLKEYGIDKELVIYGYEYETYQELIKHMYGSNCQIDLIFTGFGTEDYPLGNYKAFIDSDYLLSIDEYLSDDSALYDIYSDCYFQSVEVDGNHYGLSSKDIMGFGISAVFNSDICEKYSINPEEFNLDWDWLAEQCEKIDDDDIDLIDFQLDSNAMKVLAGFECDHELFAVGLGVKRDSDSGEIVNLYTEGADFLDDMKMLNDKGYIESDLLGTNYFVKFIQTDLSDLYINYGDKYECDGSETVEIPLVKSEALKTVNAVNGISSKSQDPETAFKVLEIINTDSEIANLLQYGIEGTDYTISDGKVVSENSHMFSVSNKLISLPADDEPTNKQKAYTEYNSGLSISKTMTYRIEADTAEQVEAESTLSQCWYGESVDEALFDESVYTIDGME